MSRVSLALSIVVLILLCGPATAAKPQKPTPEPAVAPPNVFSVKVDYTNGMVILAGENLSPATASATFGGAPLAPEPGSSDTELLFAFTAELELAIDEMGNYVLTITTDGGSFSVTAFVPLALEIPSEPPPPGEDCPCSPEWDAASSAASPDGFDGLMPYCSEDSANWVTVQFYDLLANNYWVLWTGWDSGSATGYCELYIDGPNRSLENQTQFDACANYLRNIVTVWGDQGNTCMF